MILWHVISLRQFCLKYEFYTTDVNDVSSLWNLNNNWGIKSQINKKIEKRKKLNNTNIFFSFCDNSNTIQT